MSFFSALLGSDAAKASRQGAAAQVAGLRQGEKSIKEGIGYLQPYAETGKGGLNLLADALGVNGPEAQAAYFANFQTDPGYIAERDAGVAAVEQGAASGGALRSGGTLKALQEYGQRFMRQSFLDRLNALTGVSGQGLTAAGGQAELQRDIAGIRSGIGTAQASGIVGAANAKTAGATNLFNAGVGLLGSTLSGGLGLPGGTRNYLSAAAGGSGGWNTWSN